MANKDLAKHYDPAAVEAKWNQYWSAQNYFAPADESHKPAFVIVIPPPNVTAALHMGHALNNTLQDIATRYHRQSGYATLWLPGTDHAGIATQNVVERELKKEGKTRFDLGREAFIERVWQWKDKHRLRIVEQLQKLGASCDWQRERFTMDPGLSAAVEEVFIRLYEKDLIYRGTYMINWCPRCATALSDEEVDHDEVNGHFWHIRYPRQDGHGFVEIATTRPETMLGDTAVAVHPDDERYSDLLGKKVQLPLLERELQVIADTYVDREFGTGVLKITPGHDPNDYEIGRRHKLNEINIFNNDGTLNENAGAYQGMERFAARKQIVADLEAADLLVKVENHRHSVGHCQRCATVVEPLISTQWFVRMETLAQPAIKAVQDGEIELLPNNRGFRNYMNWMENIRDWCISRQLWWGHRIPVYYCQACGTEHAAKAAPEKCTNCSATRMRQDEDVLDTWFSSWLWPFSAMGWPNDTEDMRRFYPSDVLITAQDILFFWVARMIMAGYEFTGQKPFAKVFLNGIVRDAQGRKMSKSLGNGIDPLAMVDIYGADAMRYTLVRLSADGQDINLSEHMLEVGRNFANKIWNAFRFLALQDAATHIGGKIDLDQFELADKWILTQLQSTKQLMSDRLDSYRFAEALEIFYQFFWGEYCDWYLELIKERLYRPGNAGDKELVLGLAALVMQQSMALLHPFMPFISEEIWQYFTTDKESTVTRDSWPVLEEDYSWPQEAQAMAAVMEVVGQVRAMRADVNLAPGQEISLLLRGPQEQIDNLVSNSTYLSALAKVEKIDVLSGLEIPRQALSSRSHDIEVFIPLAGIIDVQAEIARLQKEASRLEGFRSGLRKKLDNDNFVKRAPAEVVAREKEKLSNTETKLSKIEQRLQGLSQ
jgi:valyl-tRNA synthetase